MRDSVAHSAYAGVELHVARLEDVYCTAAQHRQAAAGDLVPGGPDRQQKLLRLLQVCCSNTSLRREPVDSLAFTLGILTDALCCANPLHSQAVSLLGTPQQSTYRFLMLPAGS